MAPKRAYAPCCRRHRLQAEATVRGLAQRALGSTAQVLASAAHVARAASAAVGAAGGGWAVLAAVRAAAQAAGLSSQRVGKCSECDAAVLADEGPVPQHVAVIMDGNRRFGRQKYGDSLSGHRAGGEKLRDFIEWGVELGIGVVTVFAFSTENWKRDSAEVQAMMGLFMSEVPKLGEHTVRLNVSVRFLTSDAELLPPELQAAMRELEEKTAACTGLRLNVCVSYGGRSDMTRACRQLARQVAAGEVDAEAIDERAIARHLLTGDVPDPDVLIRTSGERRLSNFLMFQLAYTELFFLEKHWPEVTREDLLKVIAGYRARHRRFGK